MIAEYNSSISTKVFEEALNAVKLWGWLKKFGSAQNILGPVKGQGIILFLNLRDQKLAFVLLCVHLEF